MEARDERQIGLARPRVDGGIGVDPIPDDRVAARDVGRAVRVQFGVGQIEAPEPELELLDLSAGTKTVDDAEAAGPGQVPQLHEAHLLFLEGGGRRELNVDIPFITVEDHEVVDVTIQEAPDGRRLQDLGLLIEPGTGVTGQEDQLVDQFDQFRRREDVRVGRGFVGPRFRQLRHAAPPVVLDDDAERVTVVEGLQDELIAVHAAVGLDDPDIRPVGAEQIGLSLVRRVDAERRRLFEEPQLLGTRRAEDLADGELVNALPTFVPVLDRDVVVAGVALRHQHGEVRGLLVREPQRELEGADQIVVRGRFPTADAVGPLRRTGDLDDPRLRVDWELAPAPRGTDVAERPGADGDPNVDFRRERSEDRRERIAAGLNRLAAAAVLTLPHHVYPHIYGQCPG